MNYKKYMIALIFMKFFQSCASVLPITPGESLYGIVTRIGSELDVVEAGVSEIEAGLQGLSSSNIESISSLLDTLVDQINMGFSITENILINLSNADSIIENIDTIIESSIEQTQSSIAVLGTQISQLATSVSAQDALIYNTTTQIDSKIDTLIVDVTNLSAKDSLIYNTATQIDSKVDTLTTTVNTINTTVNNISAQDALIYMTALQISSQVSVLATSTSGSGGGCCNSAQDALTYSTVTQIDTKMDTLTANVNNLSVQDALIYSTVTQIDTKADTLITDVNNISAQNVLIYNLESVIDSKVDTLKTFPEFVQTPTAFTSEKILSNTSRYFFQAVNVLANPSEVYVLSLQNVGNGVVRISALGAIGGIGDSTLYMPVYKGATLTAPTFNSIPSSNVRIDTAAIAFSGGTQVFELQDGTQGIGSAAATVFQYIPKELYSVTLAPGEIATVTIVQPGTVSGSARVMIMWEEIIN